MDMRAILLVVGFLALVVDTRANVNCTRESVTGQPSQVDVTYRLVNRNTCELMCLYWQRCVTFTWNPRSRSCDLSSSSSIIVSAPVPNTDSSAETAMIQPQCWVSSHACAQRPCSCSEMCVPLGAGSGHVCLAADSIGYCEETSLATDDSESITTGDSVSMTTDDSTSMTTESSTSTESTESGIYLPGIPYLYVGCYEHTSDIPILLPAEASTRDTALTHALCATNYCEGRTYYAISNGKFCYCGDTVNSGDVQRTEDADCQGPCAGEDDSDYCGLLWMAAVFKLN